MASLPPSTLPQCSLSWTQNGRSEQRIQPMATLDLHGYTKDRAIRAVTEFLERSSKQQPIRRKQQQNNPFVCIVTGVGAHSGALGGPVLKQAVHKLLIKRNMEYTYAKKRGSFLVNVHSGHVLTQNPTVEQMMQAGSNRHGDENGGGIIPDAVGQCTKVKVLPRESHYQNNNINNIGPSLMGPAGVSKKKKKQATRNGVVASYAAASATVPLNNHSNGRNYASMAAAAIEDDCPLPSEIAADEKMLESAKTQSLQDTRKIKSQRDKEQHAFQRALKTTQQEALDAERQEQEELQKIMALSSQQQQLEEEAARQAEEAELERLLQLSLQDAQAAKEHEEREEEELLQKVLSDSNLEHLQQQDEEAELERILRMSLMEQEQQQQQIVSVETEDNIDEDEELQRVLRLSLVEASLHTDSVAGSGLPTDDFPHDVNAESDYAEADYSAFLEQPPSVPPEDVAGDVIYQAVAQDLPPTIGTHGIVADIGDNNDAALFYESALHPSNTNENQHVDPLLAVKIPSDSFLHLSSANDNENAGQMLAVENPNESALHLSSTTDKDNAGPLTAAVETPKESALSLSSINGDKSAGALFAAVEQESQQQPATTISDSSLPVVTGEDLLESILYKQPTTLLEGSATVADHEGAPLNWQQPISSLGGSPSMAITEHRVVLGNFQYSESPQGPHNTQQPPGFGGSLSVAARSFVPGGNRNHETSQMSLKMQPQLQASQDKQSSSSPVPVLSPSVMEHRMMELLQRPIVSSSSPQHVAQPQSGNF